MTGRGAGRRRRARRRPAARRLAAHRRARASTTAGPAACSPRTSTCSRSRPQGYDRRLQGPGRRAVDAGRDRREAARRQGAQPTTAPAASWRRRWPRACATTSPTCAAGCPAPTGWSSRSTSRRCAAVLGGAGADRVRLRPAPHGAPARGLRAPRAGCSPRSPRRAPSRGCTRCAPGTPLGLLRGAGARGLSVDLDVLDAADHDVLAEALEAGETVALGVVPSLDPATAPTEKQLTESVLALAGHARSRPGDDRRETWRSPRPAGSPGRRMGGPGARWPCCGRAPPT